MIAIDFGQTFGEIDKVVSLNLPTKPNYKLADFWEQLNPPTHDLEFLGKQLRRATPQDPPEFSKIGQAKVRLGISAKMTAIVISDFGAQAFKDLQVNTTVLGDTGIDVSLPNISYPRLLTQPQTFHNHMMELFGFLGFPVPAPDVRKRRDNGRVVVRVPEIAGIIEAETGKPMILTMLEGDRKHGQFGSNRLYLSWYHQEEFDGLRDVEKVALRSH